MWSAQSLSDGVRVWALGDAVAVAVPQLARHDRLTLWGGTADALALAEFALGEVGPAYRLLGDAALMQELKGFAGFAVKPFSWMSLTSAAAPQEGAVGWLAADAELTALLAASAPHSYAVPGLAGVRRWAGMRVQGRLAAVAADAWSAPSVGFLAGVATAGEFRGQGLAARVCQWVSAHLVAGHGRAALIVDDDNAPALAVYGRLGYLRRPVAAAFLPR